MDDSFQPTIDMLLNVSIFAFYGAVCPWYEFAHNNVIPIYRLIFLGILVLLLRRLPFIMASKRFIHQLEDYRQALFIGFFGPIGVSAIFYLYTSLEYLRGIRVDGVQRPDAARLSEVMFVVVWFLAICSIVVHGLSIPAGKLGFYIPRVASRAVSSEPSDATPFRINARSTSRGRASRARDKNASGDLASPKPLFRIGGSIISHPAAAHSPIDKPSSEEDASPPLGTRAAPAQGESSDSRLPTAAELRRVIKFPDDDEVPPRDIEAAERGAADA